MMSFDQITCHPLIVVLYKQLVCNLLWQRETVKSAMPLKL